MKGVVWVPCLLLAACLASCGGEKGTGLQPVVSNEEPPAFISYPDPNAFTQGIPITPLVPTITGGTPTTYVVQPDLPAGLRIDFQGRILGTPTQATAPNTYIVTAGNTAGTTSFGVRITVTGTYTVGGTVNGLTGPGLVLTNNGGDPISIDANGGFTFPGAFTAGYSFLVEVQTQPTDQTCSVANGSGVITNSNYVGASVSCIANMQKLSMAGTFGEAAVHVACADEESFESLHVVEPDSGLVRLLGDVIRELDSRRGSPPRRLCTDYSVVTDASGSWVYVTHRATNAVRMFAQFEAN